MSEQTPEPGPGGPDLEGTAPIGSASPEGQTSESVESEEGLIGDDQLPEDLVPGEDNPLAEPLGEDEESDLDVQRDLEEAPNTGGGEGDDEPSGR